jgi:coenzyme F420-dependent glucose-6-phosphate dehydrogenase
MSARRAGPASAKATARGRRPAVELGYKLSSEEQAPAAMVKHAQLAEAAGFAFALISDHYHPWIDRQGQSPFVWSVIGALAQATTRLRIGTAVTCPSFRIHPAVIAQAAATSAAMLPGRFFLGLGTGENLNEHVIGAGWPETEVRQERLAEAIDILRRLFGGENTSYRGAHFTVENARLYTLPPKPPPILVAAGGRASAELAGRLGDGMIGTDADAEVLEAFAKAGGDGKPRYGELTVCWAEDEAAARRTAREIWPTAAMESALSWELPLPSHFEAVASLVTEDAVAESVTCGPDPAAHIKAIKRYADAGYDHICVHQVGPDQEGFFEFYREAVLPRLQGIDSPSRGRERVGGNGSRRRR